MKKAVILYCLLWSFAYSKDVTIDTLLEQLDKTSYQREIYNIKEKRDNKREEVYKKSDYNGVNVSGEVEYDEEQSAYNSVGKVKYGDFYVQGEKRKRDDSNFTYGIEKNLKNFIYSKDDSELKKLEVSKKIEKIDFYMDLEEQKIELINLYRDYREAELELKIRESALEILEKEKKILEKSYKLGNIAKVDLDSLLTSYYNIKLEIAELKRAIENYTDQFHYTFKINIKDYNLLPINTQDIDYSKYLTKVGTKDLGKSILQKKNIEENINYESYSDKIPDFSLGVERDTRYDENRVFFKISKDIFYDNLTLEDEKSSLEEKQVIISQQVRDIEKERLVIRKNILKLETAYEVKKNERVLEEQKYNIKKLENKLGKIAYMDVMESFDKALELKIQEEKAKNILAAYIYEIKIRGEEIES